MRRVRFSRTALLQLRQINRYLLDETGDARAGERLVRAIEARILHLAELPGTIGRARLELGAEVRSFPHGAYVVLFRYRAEDLDVIQIIHSRRDIGGSDV
jgi:toxin ParE1/3/4